MKKKQQEHRKYSSKQPVYVPNPFFEKLNGSFEKYLSEIFFCSALLLCLYLFKSFIFGPKLYLFTDIGSDSVNASWPSLKLYADYIREFFVPGWSYKMGIGQNLFPFCLNRDPFSIILYAVGANRIPYILVYVEILKIILTAWVFFLFLGKLNAGSLARFAGALSFAFSGFMILGSGWYIFTMEGLSMALLLLSFEKLYQEGKAGLMILSIFLIAISMPFNLFPLGLFLGLYSFLRIITGENQSSPLRFYVIMTLSIIIGLGLSAIFFLPNIDQLLHSPRGSGAVSYFDKLFSTPVFGFGDRVLNASVILRFFSTDLLGTGLQYKGWMNYLESPAFYAGLPVLLLFPQAFAKSNKKIFLSIFLGIWIIPMVFPFFRYAFWLFSGDYFRIYSLLVRSALGIYGFGEGIKDNKVNILLLWVTCILLIFLVISGYGLPAFSINKNLRSIIVLLLIIYSVLLTGISMARQKVLFKLGILLVLVIELAYFSSITVNKRTNVLKEDLTKKIFYNDHTNDAANFLKKIDRSFYRIDKYYSSGPAVHASINDAMMQGYFGTSSYNSFNQLNYIKFLDMMKVIDGKDEFQTRWAGGLRNRPVLEDIFSVKYVLSKNPDNRVMLQRGYDSLGIFNDVRVYRNNYNVPFGFTYDKYITQYDFNKLSPTQKDFMIIRAAVLKDSLNSNLTRFTEKDSLKGFTWEELKFFTDQLKRDTLKIFSMSDQGLEGKIHLEKNRIMFFSTPYDQGWKADVDGKEKTLMQSAGMCALALESGDHIIRLSYFPPFVKAGGIISLAFCILLLVYSLNQDRIKKVFE